MQLRKDLERRQQLLGMLNQQINVVSTHLHNLELVQQGQRLLQDAALLHSRRDGKRTFYRLNENADKSARDIIGLAVKGAKELPEYESDELNMRRIVHGR